MWANPNKAPPSVFSKNMISRDWVTSLLKIWRFSSSISAILINFPEFLTFRYNKESNDAVQNRWCQHFLLWTYLKYVLRQLRKVILILDNFFLEYGFLLSFSWKNPVLSGLSSVQVVIVLFYLEYSLHCLDLKNGKIQLGQDDFYSCQFNYEDIYESTIK